ncbi:unnamed protein product, partial [Ixodes persulcatus]
RRYGVALVGVQTDVHGQWPVLLNPGPAYIMKSSDICFYMNITKEENSAFLPAAGDEVKPLDGSDKTSDIKGRVGQFQLEETTQFLEEIDISTDSSDSPAYTKSRFDFRGRKQHLDVPRPEETRGRRPSIAPVPDLGHNEDAQLDSEDDALGIEEEKIVKGFPPVTPYIGVSPKLCYLLRDKKPLCCMQLAQQCDHCEFHNAKQYNWPNRCVILAADFASKGIYNFIVPLRAHFHSPTSLRPIVLLLERRPHAAFLDAISCFPLVYWMQGSIDETNRYLIRRSEVIFLNFRLKNGGQRNFRIHGAEWRHVFESSVSLQCLFTVKNSTHTHTQIFRTCLLPESMIPQKGLFLSALSLVILSQGYFHSQAFVKDYVITFVRLLLGVDQAPGSGFLSSMRITKEDLWIRTYGRLYQKLCSTTCEIPIGIYRTQNTTNPEGSSVSLDLLDDKASFNENIERQEISTLVRTRMQDLGLPVQDYDEVSDKRHSLSYVIINPNCDLPLEEGDIM